MYCVSWNKLAYFAYFHVILSILIQKILFILLNTHLLLSNLLTARVWSYSAFLTKDTSQSLGKPPLVETSKGCKCSFCFPQPLGTYVVKHIHVLCSFSFPVQIYDEKNCCDFQWYYVYRPDLFYPSYNMLKCWFWYELTYIFPYFREYWYSVRWSYLSFSMD